MKILKDLTSNLEDELFLNALTVFLKILKDLRSNVEDELFLSALNHPICIMCAKTTPG